MTMITRRRVLLLVCGFCFDALLSLAVGVLHRSNDSNIPENPRKQPYLRRRMQKTVPVDGVAFLSLTDQMREGAEILTLVNGTVVNVEEARQHFFNIKAVVEGNSTGSVVFDWDGADGIRIDNNANYTLVQDHTELEVGRHTLTATAYALVDGLGDVVNSVSVTFEVVAQLYDDPNILESEGYRLADENKEAQLSAMR